MGLRIMTPEQKQAIKKHADEIAAILYAECENESLKTLEDIEIAVKEQILSHVSPQIGIFLSTQLAELHQEEQRS
jgi:hypothetical protein